MYLNKCVVLIMIFNYIRADSKDITEITFNVSIKDDIPTCTSNPIRGPVTVQQRFRVSAKSNDGEFAANVTTCFFNSTTPNRIHLKPADERNIVVTSDELYFKPEMDGKHLICEFGLDMTSDLKNTNMSTATNITHNQRYPTAKCVTTIYLKGNETATGQGTEYSKIDYKMLMTIGFSLATMFLLIIIAQTVTLCICFSKGHRNKRKDKSSSRNSVTSDSGTIYEELKPIPQKTGPREVKKGFQPVRPFDVSETRTLDESDNRLHTTCSRIVPLRPGVTTSSGSPSNPNFNIQPKPPVAKELIPRQNLDGSNIPTAAVSSKGIRDIVSKFEGILKPMAPDLRVTSALIRKKYEASEQHEPMYNNGGQPSSHGPVTPTRHYIEDDQRTCMDSEDSDEWTYEPIEEVYEMPGP